MPLVILSKNHIFEPRNAAASGKVIVLIQSGIHSGEIDGKDASLMGMCSGSAHTISTGRSPKEPQGPHWGFHTDVATPNTIIEALMAASTSSY